MKEETWEDVKDGIAADRTHPATPGKPCPGGGLCCNRPEFDRGLFPCAPARIFEAKLSQAVVLLRRLVVKPCHCGKSKCPIAAAEAFLRDYT